jgi:cell wall-associated NlpC family hydrolase
MCSAVCGEVAGEVPAGPAASFGLPVSYAIPADADPAEVVAVGYALAQLGKAYRWAAAGPDEFDCSGLTMQAWAQAGVPLAHFTVDQLAEGAPVTNLALMSPGDLILTPGSDGTLAAPGHVGLYIGDGLVESAVDPAEGVIVQTWSAFISGGLSGVRHIG